MTPSTKRIIWCQNKNLMTIQLPPSLSKLFCGHMPVSTDHNFRFCTGTRNFKTKQKTWPNFLCSYFLHLHGGHHSVKWSCKIIWFNYDDLRTSVPPTDIPTTPAADYADRPQSLIPLYINADSSASVYLPNNNMERRIRLKDCINNESNHLTLFHRL